MITIERNETIGSLVLSYTKGAIVLTIVILFAVLLVAFWMMWRTHVRSMRHYDADCVTFDEFLSRLLRSDNPRKTFSCYTVKVDEEMFVFKNPFEYLKYLVFEDYVDRHCVIEKYGEISGMFCTWKELTF